MTPMAFVAALVPQDFEEWPKESSHILGRFVVTARRRGVTFVIAHSGTTWSVEKIHGGKVVASVTTERLPLHVFDAVVPLHPRQRRRRLA